MFNWITGDGGDDCDMEAGRRTVLLEATVWLVEAEFRDRFLLCVTVALDNRGTLFFGPVSDLIVSSRSDADPLTLFLL